MIGADATGANHASIAIGASMELVGAEILTTGFVPADGIEHIVSWQNDSKWSMFVRQADLYVVGVYRGYQDIYAVAQRRENPTVLVVAPLTSYSNSSTDRLVQKSFTPYFMEIAPGQHVDMRYYCLYVDGEDYKGTFPSGMQANLSLWWTWSK